MSTLNIRGLRLIFLTFSLMFLHTAFAADKCQNVLNQTFQRAQEKAEVIMKQLDYPGFLKAMKAASLDPSPEGRAIARILGMFENQQYTFAMDRSANSRNFILRDGEFKNIHQTNTSSGTNDTLKRSEIESSYLGIDLGQYTSMDHAMKPKSVYMIPSEASGINWKPTHYINKRLNSLDPKAQARFESVAEGDTWVFDRNKVKDRTLFVVGDSLDRAGFNLDFYDGHDFAIYLPAEMPKDSVLSHLLSLDYLASSTPYFLHQVLGQNKEGMPLWRIVDESHLQTDYYLSLAKKVEAELKAIEDEGRTFSPQDKDYYQNKLNDRVPPTYFSPSLLSRYPQLNHYKANFFFKPYGNYIEGLTFGKLDLTKVSALIYRLHPPTPEQMAILKKYKILVCLNNLANCRPAQ